MNGSRQPAPPLTAWLAVLTLVIVLFGGAYVAFGLGALVDDSNVSTEWSKFHAGPPLVIGVGSSLMRSGADRSVMKEDPQYQWLAFYRPGANYENFRAFFGQPLPDQPRLLLVQTDLLLLNTSTTSDFLGAFRSTIGKTVRTLQGKPERSPDEISCLAAPPGLMRRQREELRAAYSKRPQDNHGLLAWMAEQQAHGQSVVLIDIPRSPSTEARLGEPLVRWRRELGRLGIPVLHFTGHLDESDFCDGAHMAPHGRLIHTRWLRQTIQRMLDESH